MLKKVLLLIYFKIMNFWLPVCNLWQIVNKKHDHWNIYRKKVWSRKNTTRRLKNVKNRAFLTLLSSQKHYIIFSNDVLQENITRKQFNRWLGLVSISQTALRDLQPRSKGTWERDWDTLWCARTKKILLIGLSTENLLYSVRVSDINNINEKILDSDWLRAVQFKCNTSAKSVTPVQKV